MSFPIIRPEDVARMTWTERMQALVALRQECRAAVDRNHVILAARVAPYGEASVHERRLTLECAVNRAPAPAGEPLAPWRTPFEDRWTDEQLRAAHSKQTRGAKLTYEDRLANAAYIRIAARRAAARRAS